MRKCLLMALVLGLVIGTQAWTDNPSQAPADGKRIDELIQKLGSSNFTERERARKELDAIGMPALEALRKAAQSKDLETSRRAGEIVRKLEEKKTTANFLAPKKVRLYIQDKTVMEAVAELEKVSGYKIDVTGDRNPLNSRKVTLDTGETTFWEAFDKLCAAGGLVETGLGNNVAFPGIQPILQPALPIKIRPIKINPQPNPALPVIPPAKEGKPPVLQIQAAVEVQVEAPVQIQGGAGGQGGVGGKGGVAGGQGQPGAPGKAEPGKPGAAPAVKPMPIQIQVQPGQIQILPAQPIGGRVRLGLPGGPVNGQIVVSDGKPQALPTSYNGAVRIRVLPPSQVQQGLFQPARAGETLIVLDVAAEPRLQGFRVIGTPRVDKAVDNEGQTLTVVMDPNQANNPLGGNVVGNIAWIGRSSYVGNPRQVAVRLKLGEKKAQALKEFSGTVSVDALAPTEALITVDNVLKAAGQTVKGKSGGAIEVNSVEKLANGDYQLRIRLENPVDANNPLGMAGGFGVIQIQAVGGGINNIGGTNGLPVLVDAKGTTYRLVNIPARGMNFNGQIMTQNLTMVFQAQQGQGEPARLILNGQRRETISVPFTLPNVTLP